MRITTRRFLSKEAGALGASELANVESWAAREVRKLVESFHASKNLNINRRNRDESERDLHSAVVGKWINLSSFTPRKHVLSRSE